MSAVRHELFDLNADRGVLVACSGGPDSMALAAAVARLARGARPPAFIGAIVIDHQLQPDSASVAEAAAQWCGALGMHTVEVVRAEVAGGGGLEAAARRARYRELSAAAERLKAQAVLLGHTQDDQAETVLLGLTRGSGPRVLAGMPRRNGVFRRPLLHLSRETVRAAFPEVPVWHDPHNSDRRFRRSVVRHELLPTLVESLGPGVVTALARSADLTRAETEALDMWAGRLQTAAVSSRGEDVTVEVGVLVGQPQAVVARVMIAAAALAGCPRHRMAATHVSGLSDLVLNWRGQGELHLPGGVVAGRSSGTVVLRRVDLTPPVD